MCQLITFIYWCIFAFTPLHMYQKNSNPETSKVRYGGNDTVSVRPAGLQTSNNKEASVMLRDPPPPPSSRPCARRRIHADFSGARPRAASTGLNRAIGPTSPRDADPSHRSSVSHRLIDPADLRWARDASASFILSVAPLHKNRGET